LRRPRSSGAFCVCARICFGGAIDGGLALNPRPRLLTEDKEFPFGANPRF